MANYLIIAGTSSIGQAIAKKLIANGHQVFITGREIETGKALADDLGALFACVDATDFEAVAQIFQRCIDQQGELNGVVNCAGSLWLKPLWLTKQMDYEAVIAANLTTAFATVRAASKYMLTSGGSVVLMASAAALAGFANHEAIAAAKAGVIGLMLSAAASYAHHKLRFNAIAPGLVETHMTTSLTSNPTARKISEAMHPLGRLGNIDDIVNAVIFLLSPENNWITGQTLAIDGGLSQLHARAKI